MSIVREASLRAAGAAMERPRVVAAIQTRQRMKSDSETMAELLDILRRGKLLPIVAPRTDSAVVLAL